MTDTRDRREYYIANREKINVRSKKWRELNLERAKEIGREAAMRARRAKGIEPKAVLTPERRKALREEWLKANPGKMSEYVRAWQKRNPEKLKAHHVINHAIEDGKLIKPSLCERCGSEANLEGHHEDYAKPREVTWLCRQCHVDTHKERI